MSEEARLNRIMKHVGELKRGMEEEKIRCVMELEREEEGIVNSLMGRLDEVRREKRMLEERVYSGGGVGGGDGDEMEALMKMMDRQEQQHEKQQQQQQQQQSDDVSLAGPFDRLSVEAQDTTTATTRSDSNNTDEANNTASVSSSLPTPSTPSAIDVFPCLKEDEDEAVEEEEEDEKEEEEEDFNDDILGGRYHDAEMEEELEKMLKMKDSKK